MMELKFPYPKGTPVRSRRFGFCAEGHVYITTSDPIADERCESGYRQSARCLMGSHSNRNVDAGWWKELASCEDRARAREAIESRIAALEDDIRLLEAA